MFHASFIMIRVSFSLTLQENEELKTFTAWERSEKAMTNITEADTNGSRNGSQQNNWKVFVSQDYILLPFPILLPMRYQNKNLIYTIKVWKQTKNQLTL